MGPKLPVYGFNVNDCLTRTGTRTLPAIADYRHTSLSQHNSDTYYFFDSYRSEHREVELFLELTTHFLGE